VKKNLQNRREFLKATAISIAVTGLVGCSEDMQNFGSKGSKPNLLFIMTDQQRFDTLSYAGNKILNTPNLDKLARQGVYQGDFKQKGICSGGHRRYAHEDIR